MTEETKSTEIDRNDDAEGSQLTDFGAAVSRSRRGNIYTLTIIGQIEGHTTLADTTKTTKYEHILPLLAGLEQNSAIHGILLLLNTVGGDIEAGLAIAELIAGMKKPTVSLVLGGGHSIGVPLAVAPRISMIAPSASMVVHPVRTTGTVIAAPQTLRYFRKVQDGIVGFVTQHSRISEEQFLQLMFATDEMAADVGSVLYGEDAVKAGLIDRIGTLSDALEALYHLIEKEK